MGSAGGSTSSSSSQGWSDSISEYFSNAFSETRASELSNEQLGILQERRQMANNYFFPELQQSIAQNTEGTKEFNAGVAQNANAINTSYNAAQKATEQSLAQQGLKGSRTGIESALTAANNRARSSALAQAYYNQLSQAQTNKMNLLNTMGALMPQTTNSAEYYSSSVSQSAGQSQSKSESQSKSSGQGWNASIFK